MPAGWVEGEGFVRPVGEADPLTEPPRGVIHEMTGDLRRDAFAMAAPDDWFVVADGGVHPHDADVLVAGAAAAATRAADEAHDGLI